MYSFVWLFVILFGLMALGAPVGYSLLFSSVLYMHFKGISIFSAIVQSINGPMSTVLLSTGFFILAGNLMNTGGVTRKLFGFAQKLVGWIPGGLGHANVVASVIFAGMSGTALADVGGLGNIEIQAMKNEGYDTEFACAVTGSSSVIGPIIPPSVPAVLLATTCGISTGRLFFAGVVPGLLCGLLLMALIFVMSLKRGYPRSKFPTAKEFGASLKESFLALLTPFIILSSIYSGVITPSESAVMAGTYAIILGFMSRDLKLKDLPKIIKQSVDLLISILFIQVAARMFGYVVTVEQVPAKVSSLLMNNVNSQASVLFLIIIVLVICGCVIDNNTTIFILSPVLFSIAVAFGVDPVHFGMVFNFTLMCGVVTPPYGMGLFLMQGLTGCSFKSLVKAMLPFLVILFVTALLIAYVPQLSLWLPNLLFGGT